MTETERWLRSYYRRIRSFLPCSYKQKKQLISGIQQNVTLYLEENPGADIHVIQAHFGTPDQIAAACLEEIPLPELLRRLRIKRRIVYAICAALATCVLIWATVMAIGLIDAHNSANYYIEVSVTED